MSYYSPVTPLFDPIAIKERSYVNEKVEITKRYKQFIDPLQPWREPVLYEFFYVYWKETNKIQRFQIKDFTIQDDGGTETYKINGKELIIPHNNPGYGCTYQLTFDNEPLGKARTSKILEEYIRTDLAL